jgi:hypothetical protein
LPRAPPDAEQQLRGRHHAFSGIRFAAGAAPFTRCRENGITLPHAASIVNRVVQSQMINLPVTLAFGTPPVQTAHPQDW